MGDFLTLDDLDVAGRRVLVRADLNVPVRDGKVADQTRLVRLAPTIIELADKGARIVILSHFGRPEGRGVASLSLRVVVPSLGAALGGRQVSFGADCVGPVAAAAVAELMDGDVLVLENLRFHPGEEANDVGFAAQLAELGDMYVNDAFSCAHRAHASTEALAGLLPATAGRLMQAELHYLAKALDSPDRPLIAVIGGAKVSTKLDLLANLVRRVDTLLIGGGMANTFLFARGIEIGASLSEPDMADTARAIDAAAAQAGCALLLPVDAVVARALEEGMPGETVAIEAVPTDAMILDIGPETAARFASALGGSRTVVWNGPLGAFEVPPFDAGTLEFARATAKLTLARAVTSIAGGGDTVAALARADVMDSFSYVSTAGGAFLEWLEGRILPGVAALEMAAAST